MVFFFLKNCLLFLLLIGLHPLYNFPVTPKNCFEIMMYSSVALTHSLTPSADVFFFKHCSLFLWSASGREGKTGLEPTVQLPCQQKVVLWLMYSSISYRFISTHSLTHSVTQSANVFFLKHCSLFFVGCIRTKEKRTGTHCQQKKLFYN